MKPQQPFNVGSPVFGESFYGREVELRRILHHLSLGRGVNVFGPSRIGKSSLLQHIRYLCSTSADWSEYEPALVNGIYRTFAFQLPGGVNDLVGALEWAQHKVDGRRHLLLVDEGDGLLEKTTYLANLILLKRLVEEFDVLIVMSTLNRSVADVIYYRLDCPVPAPANIFASLPLPALQASEATSLLLGQLSKVDVTIGREELILGVEYVGRFPMLVQELGSLLVQQAGSGGVVTREVMAQAIADLRDAWHVAGQVFQSVDSPLLFVQRAAGTAATAYVDTIRTHWIAFGFLHEADGDFGVAPYLKDTPVEREMMRVLRTPDAQAAAPRATSRPIFVSYHPKDAKWLERIRVHLTPASTTATLDLWADTEIRPGDHRYLELKSALLYAETALVLVSADYLASEIIREHELQRVLRYTQNRALRIIPLIVSSCSYEQSPLGAYKSFNPPDRPLDKMPKHERESALAQLAKSLLGSTSGDSP